MNALVEVLLAHESRQPESKFLQAMHEASSSVPLATD